MSLQEDVERLRSIPLFAKIEPSKLKLLAFTAQRLTFNTGESLFQQGDVGDAAYIITDGSADVVVATPTGPLTVAQVGANAFVGEIAILCDVPRTATVTATTTLTTMRISKELFFELISQFPEISVEMLRQQARNVHDTTEKLKECMSKLKAQ